MTAVRTIGYMVAAFPVLERRAWLGDGRELSRELGAGAEVFAVGRMNAGLDQWVKGGSQGPSFARKLSRRRVWDDLPGRSDASGCRWRHGTIAILGFRPAGSHHAERRLS